MGVHFMGRALGSMGGSYDRAGRERVWREL